MKHNDFFSIFLENTQKIDDYRLQKDYAEKQRIALDHFDLLIFLIREQALLHHQLIKKHEIETFEKNINHALSLLAAAKEGIRNNGHSTYTDYLTTSALSYIAKYLPPVAIRNIINKLDALDKRNTSNSQLASIEKPSSSHDPINSNHHTSSEANNNLSPSEQSSKSFNDLISRVSTTLFTPEKHISPLHHNKQIVIDFAADQLPFRAYGIKRAERLGANLIQAQPDRFSGNNKKFSISKNTTLTIIGHCSNGSDHLSDNAGNRIYASELAKKIYLNMSRTDAALNTPFTIDLIACQAASPDGEHPSFAECLIKELTKYGINNASVIASPTIMIITNDGSQANLTRKEDQQYFEQSNFFNGIFSSFNSIFSSSTYAAAKLNVAKVTFRSDSADNVIQVKSGAR